MIKTALLFPGQGSQTIGMGKELAAKYEVADRIFNEADDALGFSLKELVFNGTEEELKRTENTQPALLTTSTAIWEVLKEKGVTADFAAGHSLGEYSALVAAEALPFSEAVKAVRRRGQLMEEAVPSGQGSMAAVLGMEREEVDRITAEVSETAGAVQPANYNCPGQIVISGSTEGVAKASEALKEAGAKRVLPLNVSGPFHSSLMQPAAEKMKETLENLRIGDPVMNVIANVTAESVKSKNEVSRLLYEQIYSPVLWEDTVRKLVDEGVDTFIEAGPGKVLSGLVKKVNRRAKVLPVYDEETLEKAVAALKEGK
ncbi:ACP S-malonyltransferase [Alteribacter keqinensis]|uniref:Malonyl CoA-acyl carrier protein transacylase n=1 Tax=Alteribacter keqinensis TaxID=2483800 RepID=A0A3M7TWI2_9BACI|nr:ACP S-malonyltransferase [Alteribacter keqinensis]RNA69629.1 [acyl-carrier-protein] S-malonyltransferase [Alteribacter keqinensis]